MTIFYIQARLPIKLIVNSSLKKYLECNKVISKAFAAWIKKIIGYKYLHQTKLHCSKSFKFEAIHNRLIKSENISSNIIIPSRDYSQAVLIMV